MDRDEISAIFQTEWKNLEEAGVHGTKLPGRAAEFLTMCISCPICRNHDWQSFPDNESCYDLQCRECKAYWQVKAKKDLQPSRASKHLKVLGTTYETTRNAVGYVNYIIFSYTVSQTIRNIYIIKASAMFRDFVLPLTDSKLCQIQFEQGTYRKISMV